MKYYELLNFRRDPFTNSPDPAFFYLSEQHQHCLQQLEISVRLHRGLSLVIGDVGTGKTTICRRLIQVLEDGEDVDILVRLILDPDFSSARKFLAAIVKAYGICDEDPYKMFEVELKERLKDFLLEQGVKEKRTILLIIDEGQKMPDYCMEVLRELLNFETNDQKLIQVLIFAQKEFYEQLGRHAYFRDRVSFFGRLKPFSFKETKEMIALRLQKAHKRGEEGLHLFTRPALWLIHHHSGGFPRKIIMVCSQVLLSYASGICEKKTTPGRIDFFAVQKCRKMLMSRTKLKH